MLLVAATVVYVCVVTVCLGRSCSITNLIISCVTVLEVLLAV